MKPYPLLTGTTGPGSVAGRSTITRISARLPLLLLLLLALPGLAQAQFEYSINNGTVTITKYTGPGGDVIIPGTINGVPVTGIGEGAFEWRADLTSVTISDSVTSIANSAFVGCSGLTTITISENITGIGTYAFAQCWGMTAITVDALNPFYCDLEGVLFNKDQTTLIQCPPAGKSGSYSIPNSVSIIGDGAFSGSTALTSVTIPNSVTSLGWGAFEYCTSLTTITVPDSVTNIGPAAFYECTNLVSVLIGNGVTSIEPLAFYHCSSLASIVIPDSVTSLGSDGFIGCTSLSSVIIGHGVTSIEEHMFPNCTSLISITFPNTITSIGKGVFYNCSSLTSITIPDGVNLIEEQAFSGCTELTSMMIPSSVSLIGPGAFSSCTSLTGIMVDSLNPDYESLDGVLFDKSHTALVQCPGGRQGSYTIPSSVSNIGDGAFHGCTQLTDVTIPNSVTTIGGLAFGRCTGLSSVTIPDTVTAISVRTFAGCAGLSNVTIPTSIVRIDWEAFNGCSALTNITIPNSVASIGSRGFYDCTSLSAVYFDGNAPELDIGVFEGTAAIIFYRPETGGWGPTFGGRPTLPWSVVRGDVDGDEDVDRDDLAVIVAARTTVAFGPEDTRDLDGDGKITVLDARILVTLFSVPGGLLHAAPSPDGVVLDWAQSTGAVKLQSTTDIHSGAWRVVEGFQSSTNAVVGNTAERMFFRLVLPE